MLWGRDEHLFDNKDDLVVLAPADTDRLDIFLREQFGWLLQVSRSCQCLAI